VFGKRMLRRVFGPKREKVAREECKMRSFIIWRLRLGEYVARTGTMRNAYSITVGKPERKRPLGRPSHRWKDSIRVDLREVG
jgi:hypothetical protein